MDNVYDALLIVSFGGPEGRDEVMPFLDNVLRGRNVPVERKQEVARHYELFGGISPINEQNRLLIAALKSELDAKGPQLPIYWGNRNWQPLLADTIRQMAAHGVKRALAFVTSAYSSYSGCRQYLEDIERARAEVGPGAPVVDKLRAFFNHPGFIVPSIENLHKALNQFVPERRAKVNIAFTAHSIPLAMASNCKYVEQLEETCRLIVDGLNRFDDHAYDLAYHLVFQSRSGPATQPWLEPDICDHLNKLKQEGVTDVVIAPVGFVSDHMEVIYDLDTKARKFCLENAMEMKRVSTVGTHPLFVSMVRDLILERTTGASRLVLGTMGAGQDICPTECCAYAPVRATVKN